MATATKTSAKPKVVFRKGQEQPTVLSTVEQLISLFLEIDTNDDGSVSKEELLRFYASKGLDKSKVDVSLHDADVMLSINVFFCLQNFMVERFSVMYLLPSLAPSLSISLTLYRSR